jgi:hypothetical protein
MRRVRAEPVRLEGRDRVAVVAGDIAGALEALWWWLAAALAMDEPVDAS